MLLAAPRRTRMDRGLVAYNLGFATVGALYERPRCISCAKPPNAKEQVKTNRMTMPAKVLLM